MSFTPTPFDSDAPEGATRPIFRRDPDDVEALDLIYAIWGSNPRFSDGVNYRFVQAEGKTFPSHRCLVPMTEFHMKVGNRRYRAMLETGQNFYVAAVWEPPLGSDFEVPFFRNITVAANPEIARYQDRHGAIIYPRQVMQWLDGTIPVEDLLVTPPKNTFVVEEINPNAKQTALGL